MKTRLQSVIRAASCALVAAAGSAGSTSAQQPAAPPASTRSYVQVIRLKPDMVNEWVDLQKNEVIPAQKKAGVTSRTTLSTLVGNGYEYLIITPFPSWAGFDNPAPLTQALGAEGAAALNAKLRKCIATQTSYMTNVQNELTIAGGDAAAWRTVVRRVQPGKMAEYLAFYKAEVLPGMQKAKADGKIAGATVAVRGAGTLSGEFTTTTQYAKFADIDGANPLVQALGQAAVDKIDAKSATLATAGQIIIRRRIADLSF